MLIFEKCLFLKKIQNILVRKKFVPRNILKIKINFDISSRRKKKLSAFIDLLEMSKIRSRSMAFLFFFPESECTFVRLLESQSGIK